MKAQIKIYSENSHNTETSYIYNCLGGIPIAQKRINNKFYINFSTRGEAKSAIKTAYNMIKNEVSKNSEQPTKTKNNLFLCYDGAICTLLDKIELDI